MDQELTAYLDRRFGDQDRRFDQQDRSIEDLKVEGLRSDVQAMAEGVAAVDQELERYREDVNRRLDGDQAVVQAGFKALQAVTTSSTAG